MSDEEFYNTEIKNELSRIGKLCQERGMPFLAHVQFEGSEEPTDEYPQGKYDGESTVYLPDSAEMTMRWAWYAIQCKKNIDSLFFAIDKDAKHRGINTDASLVFSVLYPNRNREKTNA